MRASVSEESAATTFRIEMYPEDGSSRFLRNDGVTFQENII
jgi:hypothetical protein